MATPYKFLTHKSDSLWIKTEKKLARWLWDDLTKLPKPAKGYPLPEDDEWGDPRRMGE